MRTNFRPKPITLEPLYVNDLFGPKSRDMVIVFEDQIQRPFMWTKYNIENDFLYDILGTIKDNIIEKNERKCGYNDIGDLVVSELDECSKKYFRVEKNSEGSENDSNIDAGHRYKLSFATKFVLNLFCQNDGEIFDKSPFINDDGSLKIDGTNEKEFKGIRDLFKEEYTVKEIKKIISKTNKNIFKTTKDKTLLEVVGFVYCFLLEKINSDEVLSNADINIINDFYSNYCYFYFSRVPLSQKWINFLSRNTGGQHATNEQMIPRDIGNYFNYIDGANEEIVNESNKAKELSEICEQNNLFYQTKKGYGLFLFSMQDVLKNKYYENGFETLKGDIVDDEKYKISSALKTHQLFKSKEDAINYFKEVYNYVDFVRQTMQFNENLEKTYSLFLNYDRIVPCLWWYFINPFFLLNKINNSYVEKEIHDILVRARAFYVLYKTFGAETNVQYLMDFLSSISNIIIQNKGNYDLMIRKAKKALYREILTHVKNGKKEYPNYSAEQLFNLNKNVFKSGIKNARFGNTAQKNVIKNVLLYDEYIFLKTYNLSHYYLHNILIGKENINLDHIIPYSIIKQNFEDEEYDETPIGNIVLLNESSNKQKGADINRNDTVYRESNIYTTSLIVNDARSNLPNNILSKINIRRYSKEIINSTEFDYNRRTEEIADRIINWIFEKKYEEISNEDCLNDSNVIVTEKVYV